VIVKARLPLLIIGECLRRLVHFKLITHFLETSSKSVNLLLLLGDGRLLLLDLAVRFQELVEYA